MQIDVIQRGVSAVAKLCLTLSYPMYYKACQPPLSTEFSRQEYWSGLPFPSPGDPPDPEIESASPIHEGRFFSTAPPGKRYVEVGVDYNIENFA